MQLNASEKDITSMKELGTTEKQLKPFALFLNVICNNDY